MQKSLRSNLLFLDAELAYPTSLGFPLRLTVEASSAFQVQINHQFDFKALVKLDKDVLLKLKLIPSANIEVAGRITFDAFVVENGLKVASTLYTATGGDLNVKVYEQGKGFDVKFGLPVEKQTIISATHDIVFTTRELGQLEKSVPLKFVQNNDLDVCLDQLKSFIGVTACADIVGPNLSGDHVPILPFPFNGNSKYTVTLEREDISVYHLSLSVPRGDDGKLLRSNSTGESSNPILSTASRKLGAELIFEALANNGDKKVSATLQGFLQPEIFIKAALDSPVKRAGAEARLINTNDEKSALARFYIDQQEYYAKAGVGVSGNQARAVYKPILEYRTPQDKAAQRPPYNVDGQIVVERDGDRNKYIFENVKFSAPNQKTIIVNGNIGSEPAGYFIDLSVGDGNTKGSLKGRYKNVDNSRVLNVEFQNSLNPNSNFDLRLETKSIPNQGKVQNSLQLTHGRDLSSKTNTIRLSNSVTYRNKGPEDFTYGTENKFSYPLVEVEAKFELEATPKTFNYDLEVQYKKDKIGSELSLKHCQKKFGDYDLEFEAYGLNNRLEIEAKREVLGDGEKSKIENSFELNGKKIEVDGTVNHRLQPQNIDFGTDLVIKISGQANPIK